MNLKQYLEKHTNGALSDAEWEQLAQGMMQAQFDRQKKSAWQQLLAERGITRTPKVARQYPLWRLLAAASVLLVAAVAVWSIWPRPLAGPAQRLAANYLEQPFRLDQGASRGEKAMDINRGRALEAFNNGQYEKAVQYLQLVEAGGQAKAADFFQLGLCLMYQHKPDYRGALNAFSAARQSDPAVYTDEINWFSGLCYLMLEDNRNAEIALQRVIDSPSSRNREAASELLQALKR